MNGSGPVECAGCGQSRWIRARGLCYGCLNVPDPAAAPAGDGFHHAFALFVPMPWAQDALCSETDPEAFFPEKGQSTKDAKATCEACLVRVECLEYALDTRQRFGVWGGRSERERRRLLGLPDDDEEVSAA